jgi:hypothetical protein
VRGRQKSDHMVTGMSNSTCFRAANTCNRCRRAVLLIYMEEVLSVCVGVGLAAACGFRIFLPLLLMSIAAASGHLTLGPSFQWIGSEYALITFSVATVLEIVAYYVPWLDNVLDSVATPAAVVAGTVVTASMVTGMSPYLQWTLAAIAGGGAAGLVQGATVLTRAASTATTGGLGNFLVATGEWVLSLVMSFLLLVVPVVAILVLAVVGVFAGRKVWRHLAQRKSSEQLQLTQQPIS